MIEMLNINMKKKKLEWFVCVYDENHEHDTIKPELFLGPCGIVAVKNDLAECKFISVGSMPWLNFDVMNSTLSG